MTKEEFERLKEEEKAHLREIKRLKGELRDAERMAKVHRAIGEMTAGLETPELDARTESLQRGAIEAEARLDMALESAGITDPSQPVLSPEEERKLKAEALVAQMKAQMDPSGSRTDTESKQAGSVRSGRPANKDGSLPEKTIGRQAAEQEGDPSTPEPEKTIGRGSARRRAAGEEG